MNITEDNYYIANEAMRDILYMCVDLVESYRGFGHGINTGEFNALSFIDVNPTEPEGDSFEIDIALLQAGSSIALLCTLLNAWDEHDTWNVKHWSSVSRTMDAYKNNRFTHLPEINRALQLCFSDNEMGFRKQLAVVYKKHVCMYFSRLSESC